MAEHQIFLIDSNSRDLSRNAEFRADSDIETHTTGPSTGRDLNKSNSLGQSIQRQLTKQKFAKYRQGRYAGVNDPTSEESLPAVDLLYENQRGVFFFGIPKYSSNSLLPTDPKPWQNGQFRTSAVDIRNAQVPDPSWEWAWKSWYVDMSRDVDEEGWEYSFAFVGKGATAFAWHGTHPWFHSFVRRRRWLRMRKRRDLHSHQTKEKGHELTAEYFTIHPKTLRTASLSGSHGPLSAFSPVLAAKTDEELDLEKMEIHSIGDLSLALRTASVDREKLAAVRKFIHDGGDELFYLSERMPDIMASLVFQSSRQRLLRDLISHHEEAHQAKEDLSAHDHDNNDEFQQKDHDTAVRHAENLLNAVHAADEQVKRLEFWSDIRGIAAHEPENGEEGHEVPSFKNKQTAEDGTPEFSSTKTGESGNSAFFETQ